MTTDAPLRTVEESIYDHPKYYDLVFGADVAAETKFILGCAAAYLDQAPGWFFEPACGTGRLIHSLFRKGYRAAGLDLNGRAVDFCNQRLTRHGYPVTAVVADMSEFGPEQFRHLLAGPKKRSRKKSTAASFSACVGFNTINSFRHVASEAAARDHFRCMASIIRPGGLYLLGVHLTPTSIAPSETESWSARRGNLAINTHMWTVQRDPKRRMERFGIRFDIHTPRDQFRIVDELRLRSYTPDQMRRLIRSTDQWEIEQTYDFAYDLASPIKVDASTEDVVYVLRRLG